MSMSKIKSTLWFDLLPTEIIFQIFDYLSSNDIIYAFFNTSQRLKNLLLENQYNITHLELPTKNFNIWKNILSIIGSQIEYLTINTINLSFPLSYFPNIKSIIILLSFNISNEELEFIFQTKQFPNIKSFKIKDNKLFSNRLNYDCLIHRTSILNKIFNDKNSLETFEYLIPNSPLTVNSTNNFQININFHSLTLVLNNFQMIFDLIKYTPNLIYLNVQSILLNVSIIPSDNINIKLKQLHLTLSMDSNRISFCDGQRNTIKRFSSILNLIKQFSSSLNCLSLNLSRLNIESVDNFSCNSLIFQQFLESMKELKEFHLYEKLFLCPMNTNRILSQYKNQYWFDHNLSFGIYRNYFYTLPFHFNHLYEFSEGFNGVQSINQQILVNIDRIWYNVKSIQLPFTDKYDENFVKELKIKMPKLTSIKFADIRPWSNTYQKTDFYTINDKIEKIDLRLDNVTTIQMSCGSIEYKKEWLIRSIPNLKHLSLSHGKLPAMNNQLRRILNEKILRLDIYEHCQLEQLIEINAGIYFSNVQYINFCFNNSTNNAKLSANIIMKILFNFKNLKVFFIYIRSMINELILYPVRVYLKNLIQCLDINEIMKNYQVKYSDKFCLFLKQELDEDVTSRKDELTTSRIFSFFSSIIRFFIDERDDQTTE